MRAHRLGRLKIVITGSAGFVGRHMGPFFRDVGADVVGLDLHPASPPARDTTFVPCDISDVQAYRGVLNGADVVVHMASAHLQVGVPESTYWATNVASLPALLRAAEKAGVRHFVHTSSVGVHGSLARVPGDEDAPFRPENVYERTKAAGELEVRKHLAIPGGMGVTIVRPAWIYGIGDARTEKLLRSVAKGRFALFGSGGNQRHPIHVADYLEGISQLVLEPRTYGKTYILAGPEPLTTLELLRTAERVTGGRVRVKMPLALGWLAGVLAESAAWPFRVAPPFSRRTLAFFQNENAFDTTRAQREFGFAPGIPLEEGFAGVWREMQGGAAPLGAAGLPALAALRSKAAEFVRAK